ncbi:MAG: 1,4-dihydroxy-2-naphthoate polyprenyltransferase [Calditrichaeota bacterium]|nr:MAG: 1,4-dihydroxy-2-naphthoate polyprenyltransferase [Calditrichota bacterium]
MANIKIWWEAARPKTLPAAAAPVIMGSAMAWHDGLFHAPAALSALLGALLIQVGTNFANDFFDFKKGADTGERLGPRRATQAGLVSAVTMKKAFVLVFGLAFISGLYLIYRGGWPVLLIGLLSILFGVLYTGGPYPLGYNGLGDIFVLIFFGPVAVGGTYYVQALSITPESLVAGMAPGLISMALLTVNNLRDMHTDIQAGKRTLAVRFGERFARWEYLLSIGAALLIPPVLIYMTRANVYSLLALLALIPVLPGMRMIWQGRQGAVLNHVLADTGKFLFLYSLAFSIGWVV